MRKERSAVAKGDTWNVEAMYETMEEWEKEYKEALSSFSKDNWSAICQYRGRLSEGPEILKKLYDDLFAIEIKLEKLYTYAHLRHDEEIANDRHKSAYMKISVTMSEFYEASSWIDPELFRLSDEEIEKYLNSDALKEYRFLLEKSVRLKEYTLSEKEERLLALSSKALQGYQKAFSAINDADIDFGVVVDGQGEEKSLSHASYGVFIRSHDRTLRKNSFFKVHEQYMNLENSLCELLQGVVQTHYYFAKARNYKDCLESSLYPKNIDCAVYSSLIEAVNEKLPALHKYLALRQEMMGIGQLHLYDMYVPLIDEFEIKLDYEAGCDLIVESVAPLGDEYQSILQKGLTKDRWVDRYENSNKRSGAYSSGCYSSMPYILMNYEGVLRDLFTLAHEAGHSMHSYYSIKSQPYQYSQYPIFLAEVASTFNESLLIETLLKRAKSDEEKIYLINSQIEDIRSTIFRQTMFAEFEWMIHRKVESNEPLTPQLLKNEYDALNRKYFGPSVAIDDVSTIEWARIPHFYYNFYVYQYATGISAALALSKKVLQEGESARNGYLNFLKSGCSQYPVDTLKLAGVDMSTPAPVEAAIDTFSSLVDRLEGLLQNRKRGAAEKMATK